MGQPEMEPSISWLQQKTYSMAGAQRMLRSFLAFTQLFTLEPDFLNIHIQVGLFCNHQACSFCLGPPTPSCDSFEGCSPFPGIPLFCFGVMPQESLPSTSSSLPFLPLPTHEILQLVSSGLSQVSCLSCIKLLSGLLIYAGSGSAHMHNR